MAASQGPVAQRLAEIGLEFGHGLAIDLSRITVCLERLGHPERALAPVIHVAGTNGKGSTCAFLRAMAEAAGLRAHVYTSPHLIAPNERVRVAGRLLDDAGFLAALDRVAATGVGVTYFEAITAAALLVFAETPADLVVLEVGLGGRSDATNVVAAPAVSVITPVDLDHQAYLGPNVAAIAHQKAGILKPGRPAVIARQHPEGGAVIEADAAAIGAPLMRCGVEWDAFASNGRLVLQTEGRLYDLSEPGLFGAHQIDNAGLAAMAMLTWGDPRVDAQALAAGVAQARWPARMQPIMAGALGAAARAAGCEVWLDGAHNPHGAQALARSLAQLQARARKRTVLVCCVLKTKDIAGVLAPLRPYADDLIAAPIPDDRLARAPAEVAATATAMGFAAMPYEDLDAALAAGLAAAGGGGRMMICGSLHLAGAVLARAGGVA
jgi:dihydrofolate synthase / folylpolyglutamate synthase